MEIDTVNTVVTAADLFNKIETSYQIIQAMGTIFTILVLVIGFFLRQQVLSLKYVASTINNMRVDFAKETGDTKTNTKDIIRHEEDIKTLYREQSKRKSCKNFLS